MAFSWHLSRCCQQLRTAGSPDDFDHSGDVPRPVGARKACTNIASSFLASKFAEAPTSSSKKYVRGKLSSNADSDVDPEGPC